MCHESLSRALSAFQSCPRLVCNGAVVRRPGPGRASPHRARPCRPPRKGVESDGLSVLTRRPAPRALGPVGGSAFVVAAPLAVARLTAATRHVPSGVSPPGRPPPALPRPGGPSGQHGAVAFGPHGSVCPAAPGPLLSPATSAQLRRACREAARPPLRCWVSEFLTPSPASLVAPSRHFSGAHLGGAVCLCASRGPLSVNNVSSHKLQKPRSLEGRFSASHGLQHGACERSESPR